MYDENAMVHDGTWGILYLSGETFNLQSWRTPYPCVIIFLATMLIWIPFSTLMSTFLLFSKPLQI